MSPERIRAFIAAPIPDAVRESLAAEQERMRPRIPGASWVRPAGIHLTLHFLGDISPGLAESLGRELALELAPLPAFELATGDPGVFPNPRRPRVLWIGLEDSPALRELHGACARVLRRRKLRIERRRYHPHLTLARFRRPLSADAGAALSTELTGPGIGTALIPVDEVLLQRSELLPRGAQYSVLSRAPLTG